MYDKYFEEYYVSEDELKVKICEIIGSLSQSIPEEFSPTLLDSITTEQNTDLFLHNLTNLIPSIYNISHNFQLTTEIEALRICNITLDSYLYVKLLEPLLMKLIFNAGAGRFIGFRYMVATELIEKVLEEDLKYNSNLLFMEIMNPQNPEKISVYETFLAQEEISRVCMNEKTKDIFWNFVEKFETSIENYIERGLPNIVGEMISKIFAEAVIASVKLLETMVEPESPLSAADKKDFVKFLSKMSQKGTNLRLGRKHGGARERNNFSWTKERKIEFYQMVKSFPQILRKKNGKKSSIDIWDFIYEQFDSRGSEAKKLLEAETWFESVPLDLLDEAFAKWERYDENYQNIDTEDSPRMFLFRHALQNLSFPSEYFNKRDNKYIPYKRSSLQKHYDEGNILTINVDNQDVT